MCRRELHPPGTQAPLLCLPGTGEQSPKHQQPPETQMDISFFGSFFHSFLSSLFMEINLSFSRTNCPQKQPPPNEAGHLICCQQWGLQAAASSTLGVNTMDSTARREPVLSLRLFVARVLLSQDTVATPSFPECKEGSTQTSSSKQGDLTLQGRLLPRLCCLQHLFSGSALRATLRGRLLQTLPPPARPQSCAAPPRWLPLRLLSWGGGQDSDTGHLLPMGDEAQTQVW